VEAVAKIRYLGRDDAKLWNDNRRGAELRLLSGWMWTAKDGSAYQQGLKTYSAAIRDAHYALVAKTAVPGKNARTTPKLRIVA
jgi:hypothetical protein